MKRGVPPTARKARTGELTPPGMTRAARSNSSLLLAMFFFYRPAADHAGRRYGSMHASRGLGRLLGFGLGVEALGFTAFVFRAGQGPEEAVGDDVAHAGPEARIQR